MGSSIKNKKKRPFTVEGKQTDQISDTRTDSARGSSKKKRKRERKDLDSNSEKKKIMAFDAPKDEIEESRDDGGLSSEVNLSSEDAANATNGVSTQGNDSHFSNTR